MPSSNGGSTSSVHQSATIANRQREADQARQRAMIERAGGPVTKHMPNGRPGWKSR